MRNPLLEQHREVLARRKFNKEFEPAMPIGSKIRDAANLYAQNMKRANPQMSNAEIITETGKNIGASCINLHHDSVRAVALADIISSRKVQEF